MMRSPGVSRSASWPWPALAARSERWGSRATRLPAAIESGADRAYVVGLPRQTLVPCRDALRWPAGARLLPLIDTRAYAIIRKGTRPLTVDWDGTLRIVDP